MSTLYTASQLARAAGASKRAVLTCLRHVPARGVVIAQGNETPAWHLADLPEKARAEIERLTAATGCADVHAFISQSPAPWQPPLPLAQIADGEITKAAKLRRALARVIELRGHPAANAAELEAIGLEDYRREFGHGITDRTLRALLKRTIERDNFAENWSRLEIYLDGNPQRKAAVPAGVPAREWFGPLHDLMATFKDALNPSSREREALWLDAVKALAAQLRLGAEGKGSRLALMDFLWRTAPWVAKSKNALRVSFVKKFAEWEASGGAENALRDGRETKRGVPVAAPVAQAVIDSVVSCATFATGGRVAQAARQVAEMAARLNLDPGMADLLAPVSVNKSYVNRRVREAVRHEVRALAPYVVGARALDTARASLDRSYNFSSGYCYSSDDVTLPCYWHVPDGRGWFNLVRGQCLLTIDVRSLRILGFSLQPDRNYSSPVIHTNFTRVFADFGVPRKLYLERGIWESSKIITGRVKSKTNHPDYKFLPFSWAEMRGGFGDLGVEFLHAIRARSKVVERVIGLVQDLMEAEPGYCGRDERRDCPQVTREHMDDVKFHRVHPSKNFYDFGQWEARLVEIFAQYNRTAQQGKILAGLSPDEGWEKFQSADPNLRPMLFDETCRHLLAHYRVEKQIGKDGAVITIGKKKWTYRSERLARDKFKRMICWFNPDEPSSVAVTDLNMKNPYTVPLAQAVDALDPDPQAFATELARVAEYEAHGKARYQVLKAQYAAQFRRFVPSRATVETGQAMRQQREVIETNRQADTTRKTRIHRRAKELGLPAAIVSTGRDGDEGTALMIEARRLNQKEQSQTPSQP